MIHTFTEVTPTAICKLHDASVDDKLNAYDIPMIQSNESIWVNGETNENSNSEFIWYSKLAKYTCIVVKIEHYHCLVYIPNTILLFNKVK